MSKFIIGTLSSPFLNFIGIPSPSTRVIENFKMSDKFLVSKTKLKLFDCPTKFSESEKTACTLFDCPFIISQS